ncbi:hypothetical protein SAMN02745136_04779 [Anaerocolumna jejuensis DSM 15929]|uniref:Uncharacterized protein n=1 Tax=Anaerocolumna jejuensis DSM 15929 TaxID=1121322 RepID=A0A1M7A7J6_9FIRM|nr:hypothetical protein [Anaerocolumna jejuensis]SHL38651.1 hypothetical protein SAMN02745136_04779 [Anaerocolumna jejuensis DSM 15929]
MKEVKDESKISKELIKAVKPRLFLPVWTTVICSGPPLNLLLNRFLFKDAQNPTVAIIMTIIAIIGLFLSWYWYIKEKRYFRKLEEEIPKVVHYLHSMDKSFLDEELIKLTDIVHTMPRKEILRELEDILDGK